MSYLGVGNLLPGEKAKVPSPGRVGQDYLGLIKGFASGQSDIFAAEQEWKPKYIGEAVGNLQTYGAPAVAAYRAASPEQARLTSAMTEGALAGPLSYTGELPPGMLRQSQQISRAGQAARGMGFGPADLYGETGDALRLSADLTDRNRAFATDVSRLNQAQDAAALSVMGAGPTIIPGEQSYDTFNTAYNARAAAQIAAMNANAAKNAIDY